MPEDRYLKQLFSREWETKPRRGIWHRKAWGRVVDELFVSLGLDKHEWLEDIKRGESSFIFGLYRGLSHSAPHNTQSDLPSLPLCLPSSSFKPCVPDLNLNNSLASPTPCKYLLNSTSFQTFCTYLYYSILPQTAYPPFQ